MIKCRQRSFCVLVVYWTQQGLYRAFPETVLVDRRGQGRDAEVATNLMALSISITPAMAAARVIVLISPGLTPDLASRVVKVLRSS